MHTCTHTHTYIYIYIYICVCVCVCVCVYRRGGGLVMTFIYGNRVAMGEGGPTNSCLTQLGLTNIHIRNQAVKESCPL